MNTTPANIIAQQIGGGAFYMMGTQHRTAADDGNTLVFNVRGTNKCKWIRITLDPCDTYSVRSYKVKRGTHERILIEEATDIYNDSLLEVLRRMTGLETRLPRVTYAS